MHNAQSLITALQQKSKGTPYQIEGTGDDEFTVKLNIVDTKYHLILYKNGVKRAFKITAKINADKRIVQTTDSLYSLDWHVGGDPTDITPSVNWNAQVQQGEIYTFETRKDLGIKADGSLGAAVNYSFNSGEAKRWLNKSLQELGWKRVWGKQAKIGLLFAIIGGGGALIAATTLLALLIFSPGSFNH